jgi:hypothetical protein
MLTDDGATPVDEVAAPELPAQEVPVAPEKPTEPTSIDDTIRNTLRDIQARSGKQEAIPETPESPEQKAERLRNDKGQFAKGDTAETAAEATATETPATPEPVIKAPSSWKKGAAEKFASVDPEVRAEIERREGEFHKGLEQYKAKAQFGDAMERAITPHLDTLRAQNVAPDKAVAELLQADRVLRYGTPEQKQKYFSFLAQSYGVDPTQLTAQEAAPVDPNIAALQKRIEDLSGYVQNQQLVSKQQQEKALNSEISAFAADPKNRHFETVRSDMAALLQAGLSSTLADAYERAIYANPTTRALVLAEQQAAARAEAGKKAQAAKQASSVNVPRRPSLPASEPIGTMDETIRSTLRKLRG